MMEMARVVSAEGGQLVERQTQALLGDIKALTKQVGLLPHMSDWWCVCGVEIHRLGA
jgi:hypothetical protein